MKYYNALPEDNFFFESFSIRLQLRHHVNRLGQIRSMPHEYMMDFKQFPFGIGIPEQYFPLAIHEQIYIWDLLNAQPPQYAATEHV